LANGILFQFTIDYLNRHPEFTDPKNVPVTDALLSEFAAFVERSKVDFQLEGEKELQKFLQIAERKRDIDSDVAELVEVALSKLRAEKQRQFQENKNQIRELLIAEFAEKSGGLSARIAATIGFDNQLQAALQVVQNHQEYREILAIR
jgi:post-segregation antitoxin (ccd killing protein)